MGDEAYIRVSGKCGYLWRIIDQNGQFIDFILTAKRDSKVAKAFLKQARGNYGLYPPVTMVTDKASAYPAIIQAMGDNAYFNQPVKHTNHQWKNNRIESDHASFKTHYKPRQRVQNATIRQINTTGY